MRRTNPKRYDKRHDQYDDNNDAGHDSGIENRFEDPPSLISWDISEPIANNIDELIKMAVPGQIWRSKKSEDIEYLYIFDKPYKKGRCWIGGATWAWGVKQAIEKYTDVSLRGASWSNPQDVFPFTFIGYFEVPSDYDKLSWDISEPLDIAENIGEFLEFAQQGDVWQRSQKDFYYYVEDALTITDKKDMNGDPIINGGYWSRLEPEFHIDVNSGFHVYDFPMKLYLREGKVVSSKLSLADEMEIEGKIYVKLPDPSGASGSIGAAFELKKRNGRMWCPKDRKKEFDELMSSIEDDLKKSSLVEELDWQVDALVNVGRDEKGILNRLISKRAALTWDIPDIRQSWDLPEQEEIKVGDMVKIVSNVGNGGYSFSIGRSGFVDLIFSSESSFYDKVMHGGKNEAEFSDVDMKYFNNKNVYIIDNLGLFTREDLELIESKKAFDLDDNRVSYESIPQDIRFKFREQHQDLFNRHPEILQGMNNIEFVFTNRPYGIDPSTPGYIHPDDLEVDLYGTPELLKNNPEAVVAMLNVILQHVLKLKGFEKTAATLDPELLDAFDKSEKDYVIQHENRLQRLGPSTNVVWSSPEVQKFRFTELLKLGDFTDKKILDIGCGFGSFLDFIKEHGQIPERYIGIDLSEKMLEESRKQHPEEFFELRNVRVDPFDTDVFDYGIASGIFANDHNNWDDHVIEILKSILNSCKLGIGVNFLHEHMSYIGGGLHYDNPNRVVDMLGKALDAKIELLDNPEDNDFTLLIRK
ncbi:MAG: methyltransferase domain-containing protein [Candidatus Pacearchaeota archaeon]